VDIGYVRFKKDNINTRTLNAMAHSFYGLNLIVFGPNDINTEEKTVNGSYFTPNGWKKKEVPLPKIINNMRFKKNNNLYKFLNNNSFLLFHNFGSKDTVEEKLKQNNLLSDLIIPSRILTPAISPIEVLRMFDNHNKLIFKPAEGLMGRGIFIIDKKSTNYEYIDQKTKKYVNEKQIIEILKQLRTKYIVQKYIGSNTPRGLPFDIRVQYEKNGKGKWVKAQVYARIGITNKIVSNIAKGGSVIRIKPFLKSNYGDEKGEKLYKKLNDELLGFPSKFEKLYNFNVSTIAIDLGLENDKFYLFEVNSFPGGTFARGEIAMLRAAYARYLTDKLFNNEKQIHVQTNIVEENKRLVKENSRLLRENKEKDKKLNKVINSRSWKYTSLFRKNK
jgi:glutathione synthase/RimK-type ligase-like ATP-grasp enzyme